MAQRRRPPQRSSGSGQIWGVIAALAVMAGIAISIFGPPDISVPAAEGNSEPSNVASQLVESARTHDKESYVYGGGHPLSSYKKGDGLDCSSLISVAVRDVTGIKKDLTARMFRNDSNWKAISFSEARKGDIVYLLKENHPGRSDDHVAFVVRNGGKNDLTIFEAATSRVAQPDQIREDSGRSYSEWDGALRFHK